MREQLPTGTEEIIIRFREALEAIKSVAEHPEKYPELVRNNKLHVYMWQLADDALNGKSLPIGG